MNLPCHPPSSDDTQTPIKELGGQDPACVSATVPVAQHVENVTQSTCVCLLSDTLRSPVGAASPASLSPIGAGETAPLVTPPVTVRPSESPP